MKSRAPNRPMCRICNRLPGRPNGKSIQGFQLWQTVCSTCAKHKYSKKVKKKSACELCNFVAVDSCQLCLIDEQTVCQNCNSLRQKNKRPLSELTVDATVDLNDIRL